MSNRLLKVYAIAVLLGVITGIVSSCFQLAIQYLDTYMSQSFSYIKDHGGPVGLFSTLLSMVMVYIAWLMVRDIAPEAAGSGIPEIEGALAHVRPIFWRRLLPVKFVAGVISISSKLVFGREGPTIQMGGNLGDMLGEFFKLTQARRDILIMAGAAAGLASAFNAPLAGVLFVMEELRYEFNFTFTNFKLVAIACMMATIAMHCIIGSGPAISMDVFEQPNLQSLWLFFLFGIMVGFVGLLFNKGMMLTLALMDKITKKRTRVGYVLLVGALAGYFAYYQPNVVGGGYSIIHQAVTLTPGFSVLITLIVVRFFTTMISYSTGAPGGFFAPMLALGSLLGTAAFYVLNYLIEDLTVHPGMFAVAGMGALFSAAVRAPITGIILVVEMTQNYSLILPLMVSCLTSTTIMQLAADQPIYTQLLRRTLKKERQLVR
ncbi:H(+)/Cl(-) exchange transporter ClcA [Legionella massiliensis]|uniref:H(+)/Cl(-) exchange transporter ClcA n=1 Tax=Legionella massiliensis TaxID=1034943 RepID=A0A078L570_9GAMM|nr:H(+)/Cl(-) exchange transporter ClcA [Legionella massiliensis]CDZ79058.1 H(+)/Cl(-) exchange transporter ClcA [Legionella massiliensis]CEE14796.1 H(+)/Cl(-) exchange transporter ClcA [Legionella massiliensis]